MKFICPKAPAWTYMRNKINETEYSCMGKGKKITQLMELTPTNLISVIHIEHVTIC
jgi:hypothetical protein